MPGMLPQVVKYRIWNLALRMNAQMATYSARTVSIATGGADSLKAYSLLRVTYDEPSNDEIAMVGGTFGDVYAYWTICQVDLDLSGAPAPNIGFELTFSDGTTWIVRNVKQLAMRQAFRCLCQQARPQ